MDHDSLGIHEQHDLVPHNINQDCLRRHCFYFSMKGLNIVLSICMGLSFGEVVEGWASILGGKFLCVVVGGS